MYQMNRSLVKTAVTALLISAVMSCGHSRAAGPKGNKKAEPAVTSKPTLRLTTAEKRFLRATERQLVTKLNGKDNPGDSKTWYTLLFLDEVAVQTVGASSSSSQRSVTVATMLAAKPDGIVVQGKEDAALAVARFMYGINSAAKGLKPISTAESRNSSRAAGNKRWWYYAFRTKQEAEKFLLQAIPQKAKKK